MECRWLPVVVLSGRDRGRRALAPTNRLSLPLELELGLGRTWTGPVNSGKSVTLSGLYYAKYASCVLSASLFAWWRRRRRGRSWCASRPLSRSGLARLLFAAIDTASGGQAGRGSEEARNRTSHQWSLMCAVPGRCKAPDRRAARPNCLSHQQRGEFKACKMSEYMDPRLALPHRYFSLDGREQCCSSKSSPPTRVPA